MKVLDLYQQPRRGPSPSLAPYTFLQRAQDRPGEWFEMPPNYKDRVLMLRRNCKLPFTLSKGWLCWGEPLSKCPADRPEIAPGVKLTPWQEAVLEAIRGLELAVKELAATRSFELTPKRGNDVE